MENNIKQLIKDNLFKQNFDGLPKNEITEIADFIENIGGLPITAEIEENEVLNAELHSDSLNKVYFDQSERITSLLKLKYIEGNTDILLRVKNILEKTRSLWDKVRDKDFFITLKHENSKNKRTSDKIRLKGLAVIKLLYINQIISLIDSLLNNENNTTPENTPEAETSPETKPFIYTRPDILDIIYNGLKPFFDESEHPELKKALNHETISKSLFFFGAQNRLSELFLRLHYNGLITGQKTNIAKWICETFNRENKSKQKEPFNYSTVWGVIGQGKMDPGKNKRLLEDLAGYMPKAKRKDEPEPLE